MKVATLRGKLKGIRGDAEVLLARAGAVEWEYQPIQDIQFSLPDDQKLGKKQKIADVAANVQAVRLIIE